MDNQVVMQREHSAPTNGQVPSQTIYHYHYTATPTGTNNAQEQSAHRVYEAVQQALDHAQNNSPADAPRQKVKPTKKDQAKYYKPRSTEVPVLLLFFLSTLVFIAGIEYMLRRSIPVGRTTSSELMNALGNGQNVSDTSKVGGLRIGDSGDIVGARPSSSCIGVERIISVSETQVCGTATLSSAPCHMTTVSQTYEAPIYNVPVSTMPCYVCALEAQKIPIRGWITATTTHYHIATTAKPATVQPCDTCQGIQFSVSVPWPTTITDYARPYVTYASGGHNHPGAHMVR